MKAANDRKRNEELSGRRYETRNEEAGSRHFAIFLT